MQDADLLDPISLSPNGAQTSEVDTPEPLAQDAIPKGALTERAFPDVTTGAETERLNLSAEVADPLVEALEILSLAGFSFEIEDARQVYTNRDLRMSNAAWVGFDMDYTLALYHQRELDELTVRHALDTLVDEYGYPEEIRTIAPDHDFAIRGLVIDRELGNILKMDSHGYVGKVFHGTRPASDEVRRRYHDEPVRIHLERYVLVDTLFALPEAALYAALTDFLETRSSPAQTLSYERLYDHVRGAIDKAHADGRIKREILLDLPRYVIRDPDLAPTLHAFRSAGKRLFLLTNSEWYYTREVMAYLLKSRTNTYPSWRNYFDAIITSAQKPTFFRGGNDFAQVDSKTGLPADETVERLDRHAVYEGGNITDFEEMLEIRGSEVVYIGDHIYGDIVRSKRDSAWRTVMIIQEMEVELKKRGLMRTDLARWAELDERLAALNSDLSARRRAADRLSHLEFESLDEVTRVNIKRALRELKHSVDHLSRLRREFLHELIALDDKISHDFNPYWGLLFKEGAEHSIFGGQVESYACLYTSRVSNFRRYSPMRYFRARRQIMPHEG